MKNVLAIFVFLFSFCTQGRNLFYLVTEKLDPKNLESAQAFVNELNRPLPERLKTELFSLDHINERGIGIQFKQGVSSLGDLRQICDTQKPGQKLRWKKDSSVLWARAHVGFWDFVSTSKFISVDSRLLGPIQNHFEIAMSSRLEKHNSLDIEELACGMGNFYKETLASVLGELAWIYDMAGIEESPTYSRGLTVSEDRQFLNLAGWVETGFIFSGRNQENNRIDRRPDVNELRDPTEYFVVNFPRFLLDSSFACRRPALNQFFEGLFEHKVSDCVPDYRIPMTQFADAYVPVLELDKYQEKRFVNLDPRRIYSINYLLAGPGESAVSAYGHSMFHLVICAPERMTVDIDCTHDVEHHVVLSFRAPLSESQINYFKALTGGYPSILHVHSLKEVVEEYTAGEFRNLYSFPLILGGETGHKMFINRVLEYVHTYNGYYYYLSNNCAVETLNFLKSVIRGSELENFNPIKPMNVTEAIWKSRLTSMGYEEFSEAVKVNSLYVTYARFFPSQLEAARTSFSKLAKRLGEERVPWTTTEKLFESKAQERKLFFDSLDRELQAELGNTFSVLEGRIYRKDFFDLRMHMGKSILILFEEKASDEANSLRKQGFDRVLYGSGGALDYVKGYGVPIGGIDSPDVDSVSKTFFNEEKEAVENLFMNPELINFFKETFKNEIANLVASKVNRAEYRKAYLRTLRRQN